MEGAEGQTFCLPEDFSISAMASYIGTSKLDIDDPVSLVAFLTQSTFESILTGPDFDLPAQEIKYLPMLLDANKSAPLESCWSINALAVSSAESVQSYPEVLTLDEDYDDDYDVTVEERDSKSVRSDPTVLTLGDFRVTGHHLTNLDLPEMGYCEPSSTNGEEVSIDGTASERLVLVEPMPQVPNTGSQGSDSSKRSSNYDGEEEVMKTKRRKLVC